MDNSNFSTSTMAMTLLASNVDPILGSSETIGSPTSISITQPNYSSQVLSTSYSSASSTTSGIFFEALQIEVLNNNCNVYRCFVSNK